MAGIRIIDAANLGIKEGICIALSQTISSIFIKDIPGKVIDCYKLIK